MTTKQAIRKVLSNTDRFIVGDMDGQKWYCPDGYIATTTDIYSEYKPKKSQQFNYDVRLETARQAKMNGIFDKLADSYYNPITNSVKITDSYYTTLSNLSMSVDVNSDYYEFMQVLYPNARFELDSKYWYSPVKVIENNKLVALIMPLKK